MKDFGNSLLSLAAPFLIVIALFGLFQRESGEKWQSFPALVVGAGLIVSGALGWRGRRKQLLDALQASKEEEKLMDLKK